MQHKQLTVLFNFLEKSQNIYRAVILLYYLFRSKVAKNRLVPVLDSY